jgi:hypothetical protein
MDSDGSEFLMESEDEDGPRGGRRARYSIPMGARCVPPLGALSSLAHTAQGQVGRLGRYQCGSCHSKRWTSAVCTSDRGVM